MKIELSSTSYLLPNNKNWELLEKLSNINFNDYGNFLSDKKTSSTAELVVFFLPDLIDYFNSNSNEKLEIIKIKNILILVEKKLKKSNKSIIISVSEFLYHNTINFSQKNKKTKKYKFFFIEELIKLTKKYKNLYILDLEEIFSPIGFDNCFDQRNYYLCRCRLSTLGIEILADNLKKILNRIKYTNKKVLLLDCDNTLWGGVVAEDGLEKIQIKNDGLGLAYYEFQKAIKKIKDSGILIALVSKNNKNDVENVFNNHDSMYLKSEDITCSKVNWVDKSKNIIKIAKELNLDLNSFVYWDDNPIERDKVRINLKDVTVFEPDEDVAKWPLQLLEYEGFSKFETTKSDKLKSKQYKQRSRFIDDKTNNKNEITYLKSINIKPKKIKINNSSISRAVQMCQKTNQFNLRTIRSNASELKKTAKKNDCFLVNLQDIYGDHGLVSLVSLKKIDDKHMFIDNFLMSCRIIGRHLESWILAEIVRISSKQKIKYLLAEYIPTPKNQVVKDFLISHKFKKIKKEELKKNNKNLCKFFLNKKSEYYIFKTNTKIPYVKEIYENN
jgi:FkbH-like protein